MGSEREGIAGRLPHYEAVCELARGGMAQVHLGRTRTSPPSFVVIKTLPVEYRSDPERADMLADEIRVGRLLRHPNIVRVLDAGVEAGEPFVVMEYVDGPSLLEVLAVDFERGTTIDLDLVLALGIGLCDGLHYAHLARDEAGAPLGIVHRDVSPTNLMVDGRGVPKVLDFGVVRARGRRHETTGRAVKGKLAYAAPEYVLGKVPDRRADVFGLGVVLWEASTGRRLFHGASMAETVRAVLSGPIPLPSVFNPRVPPGLDEAIRGALCREVKGRWRSAAELRDTLFVAAGALGGVLSASEVAMRMASRYPELAGAARVLRAEMPRDELASRVVTIRACAVGSSEWRRQSAPDTVLEVDVDPVGFEGELSDSVPDLVIPPDLLEDG